MHVPRRYTTHVKDLLTRLGSRCSTRTILGMNSILNFVEVGYWIRSQNLVIPRRFGTRNELFDFVSARVAEQRVLYLEFGVASGACTRYWSAALKHREAHLHGFDSFLGLPTGWARLPRGFFSTGGVPPDIDDSRVQFFVGLFQETLPEYHPPDHDCVVVIMDSDLYSSTAYVLDSIRPLLRPGSYLYFDDFHHRADEQRAFREFLDETKMTFEVVGATLGLTGVFFRRTEADAIDGGQRP